jgi:hypothetical protein
VTIIHESFIQTPPHTPSDKLAIFHEHVTLIVPELLTIMWRFFTSQSLKTARSPINYVANTHESIILNTARTPSNYVAMCHERLLSLTARNPSKYVAMFNEPVIPYPARAPSK